MKCIDCKHAKGFLSNNEICACWAKPTRLGKCVVVRNANTERDCKLFELKDRTNEEA